MTREEIIKEYEDAVVSNALAAACGNKAAAKVYELFKAGLHALRPVSREQMEKVWRGCHHCLNSSARQNLGYQYCEHCGRPLTDEAVDMVMERLEAIQNG